MNAFIHRFADRITGVLSGFDRLVFRGYLRQLVFVTGMLGYLRFRHVPLTQFGKFAYAVTEQLKRASLAEAERLHRPVVYLSSGYTDKEAVARRILLQDPVQEGLICVIKCLEPCSTYDVGHVSAAIPFGLRPRRRKCEFLYHYFIDPVFGFMNARIQTWLPFSIQICLNGREWLARQMDYAGLRYERRDNCFPSLDRPERAQKLMDHQLRSHWPTLLNRIASRLNPERVKILGTARLPYYWTAYQTEWATDFMFRDAASLAEIYPRLTRHAISAFSSRDVIRFLGGKVHGAFRGEIVSDFKDRPEGVRVKHRVDGNSVKIYDKQGSVLRVETTINEPSGIKVFRPKEGDGRGKREWRPMRRGIADLHRRAQVSQASNERYVEAIAAADTSASLGQLVAGLSRPERWKGRRARGLRPWSSEDLQLFKAVNSGEFAINGFRNADLQQKLYSTPAKPDKERHRRSSRVTRLIRLLRAHHLVRKLAKTRRYRLTPRGREALTAILAANDISLQKLNQAA